MMRSASRQRLATQAGLQAAGLCLGLGTAGWLVLRWWGVQVPIELFAWTVVAATLVGGLLTRFYVQFAVSRRIRRVARVLEGHARSTGLQRLPDLGDDEIGEIGRAVNMMLASLTSLEVQMIEQGHELRHTKNELVLKEALEAKSAELEQRLKERALLFDIVRASASEREIQAVLSDITTRLGVALNLRECFLFLADTDARRLVLRATHGLDAGSELLGRTVLFDEPPFGPVAENGEALVLEDLASAVEARLLWAQVPTEGAMVVLPVVHRAVAIGVMAATRRDPGSFSPEEMRLLSAITDQLGLAIRHTQLFEELRRGSQHDDLTGLGNRRLLRLRLEDELHRAERFGQLVSVLAIDVDYFKALNDRHGHPTGDASLRKLAGLMTRNLRRIDTIARTGGEEFVVLLPRTSWTDAEQVGDKIRRIVEATDFPGGKGQPNGKLTISVGVATLALGETSDELLARADTALYEAKALGRNRVAVASPQAAGSIRSVTRSRI